jgi:hypothetical protein
MSSCQVRGFNGEPNALKDAIYDNMDSLYGGRAQINGDSVSRLEFGRSWCRVCSMIALAC